VNQKEIGDILRTNLLAIETIIWLPGCWAIIPDEMKELIEEGEDDATLLVEAGIPLEAMQRYEGEEVDRQDFGEYELCERDLTGFLVKVGTPVPDDTRIGVDGIPEHGTYSWGWSTWKWFFVQELDDIVEPAIAWKRERCAKKHAKNNP
jgi:hypothetical protein